MSIASQNQTRSRPAWRRWPLLLLLAWTALAALGLYFFLPRADDPAIWIVHEESAEPVEPLSHERVLAWSRTGIGIHRLFPWVLFGPYLGFVSFFFPLERGRLRSSLPLHIAACATFLMACSLVNERTRAARFNVTIIRADGSTEVGTTNHFWREPPAGSRDLLLLREFPPGAHATNVIRKASPRFNARFGPPPPAQARAGFVLLDLLACAAMVSLAHSVHFYRRFREREHRALELETNLARARLEALRAQLHPHFLFNSLNAVATLLRRDPAQAERTLVALSDLLRLALNQSDDQEIPLEQEIQFVEKYLDIQRTRFGDRLRVAFDLEPEALRCRVPLLLLQPLVENSIRHGLEPAGREGLVRVTAAVRNGKLVLGVEDDGVGFTKNGPEQRAGSGIGLKNVRARLEAIYGEQQKLELRERPGGGLLVSIEIPSCAGASTSENK